MKRLGPVLVVFALLLAGCTGPASTNPTEQSPVETTGTATPHDTGTTPTEPITATPTPTPTRVTPVEVPNGTLVPGVTDEGIENASRLLSAHAEALRERGFALSIERRSDAEGGVSVERHVRSTASLDRFRSKATYTIDGNQTVRRSWLNETMTRMLVRIDSGDRTRYRIPPIGPAGSAGRTYRATRLTRSDTLARLLGGGEFDVTRVVERDGRPRYTLVGTNFSENGLYGDREVRLTVGKDGVVWYLNATGETADGDPFVVEYRVQRLGVDAVERPDWVADAPQPVNTRPIAGLRNCSTPYLEVENPGPDAIPAGSVVEVTFDGTTHRVALERPVPADGRRAIYLNASGSLKTAPADEVPTNRTAMPNEVQFTIATDEGMLLTNGAVGLGCASASGSSGSGSSATN